MSLFLHVHVLDAEKLPKMDKIGKIDPYCVMKFTNRPEIPQQKTKVIKKSFNPEWNENFVFHVSSLEDIFSVTVMDYDKVGKDEEVSYKTFPVLKLPPGLVVDKYFKMKKFKGVEKGGKIHLALHLTIPEMNPFVPVGFNYPVLHVKVMEASDIAKMDVVGYTDAYCVLNLVNGLKVEKTKVIDNNMRPKWNELFSFQIANADTDILHIHMMDKDLKFDDDMADLDIHCNELEFGRIYDKWFSMIPVPGVKKGGNLRLRLQLAPEDTEPFQVVSFPVEGNYVNILEPSSTH